MHLSCLGLPRSPVELRRAVPSYDRGAATRTRQRRGRSTMQSRSSVRWTARAMRRDPAARLRLQPRLATARARLRRRGTAGRQRVDAGHGAARQARARSRSQAAHAGRAGYLSVAEAAEAVPTLVRHDPIALEGIDHRLVRDQQCSVGVVSRNCYPVAPRAGRPASRVPWAEERSPAPAGPPAFRDPGRRVAPVHQGRPESSARSGSGLRESWPCTGATRRPARASSRLGHRRSPGGHRVRSAC